MTQAMLTRWLGAVLAFALLALPLRADQAKAEQGKPSHPYVVLVGISGYTDKQIKPRPHAEDDAKALFKLLTDKKYLGADAEHSRLLLGDSAKVPDSQPATRANILKALHWIRDKAKAGDLVIFGYFGEGGPLGDTGAHRCYFASDSTFAGRDKDALAASEIGEALKGLKSQRFCVFLDVDFKGFTTTDKKVAEPTLGTSLYPEYLGAEDSEEELAKPGRSLFSILSNVGLTRPVDLKDHGVFAESVLKGLQGAADKDGYEPDGLVTVDELREYLDKDGREAIRKHAKTKEDRNQFFVAIGGTSNHYVLTHNPAVAGKITEQVDKFAQMLKDGKVPEKYAEEGKSLLERMPRLEAQRKLRKEYQALLSGKIDLDKFTSQHKAIIKSTKLPQAEAADFAEKVMGAIRIVTGGYVKKLDKHDLVVWAIKGLYRQVDVTGTTPVLYPNKIPDSIEARLKDVNDMNDEQLEELLAAAREAVGKREDLDKHKDIDWTLKRMLHKHTDPYTTYIDKEEKERMKREIGGRFAGVGIQIRKDAGTDQLLVVTPIKGSPAYKAHIEAGDLITTVTREVDGEGEPLNPPEVLPTKGMKLNDAVEKITGKPGTEVILTIKREGEEKPLVKKLTRGYVNVESVLGFKRKSDDNWDYMIDPENKIAYIRLTQFARNSYSDMYKLMGKLTESDNKIKGFILDLRGNPGGLLDVAFDISDLFIDDGVVVSIRERGRPEKELAGNSRGSLLGFSMVCLVNGYSASGSEIVAACLQDHDRAYIIGERSYGKGSVQHILDFDGGEIKLTTATFWRPSKKNLNKSSTSGKEEDEWGVMPNKVIKLTAKERDDLVEHLHNTEVIQPKGKPAKVKKFDDKQLDEALKYLRNQIRTAQK